MSGESQRTIQTTLGAGLASLYALATAELICLRLTIMFIIGLTHKQQLAICHLIGSKDQNKS